eukprot:301115-Hanusia_phi.AAC.3
MDPVMYGCWDDTQTLTVGCVFHNTPQMLVEPSLQIFLNITFIYAAAIGSITSDTESMIRTILVNVIGPTVSQSDISLEDQQSVSSSFTSMNAVINFKSKLASTKGGASVTASTLNAEAVRAGLQLPDMFTSVSTNVQFADCRSYQLNAVPPMTITGGAAKISSDTAFFSNSQAQGGKGSSNSHTSAAPTNGNRREFNIAIIVVAVCIVLPS